MTRLLAARAATAAARNHQRPVGSCLDRKKEVCTTGVIRLQYSPMELTLMEQPVPTTTGPLEPLETQSAAPVGVVASTGTTTTTRFSTPTPPGRHSVSRLPDGPRQTCHGHTIPSICHRNPCRVPWWTLFLRPLLALAIAIAIATLTTLAAAEGATGNAPNNLHRNPVRSDCFW
jgi:hypothetical protein